MSNIKEILDAVETAQARISKVILCNPKQKDTLQKVAGNNNCIYLIEDSNVELNQAVVVNDLELKKAIISNYLKNRRVEE